MKVISAAILTLIAVALFSGSIMANAMGDENYFGENDEQPGVGVGTSTEVGEGSGEQNDEMPAEDRTRNKDATVITVLPLTLLDLIIMPVVVVQ